MSEKFTIDKQMFILNRQLLTMTSTFDMHVRSMSHSDRMCSIKTLTKYRLHVSLLSTCNITNLKSNDTKYMTCQ
jgi:hypothetical protein